MERSVHHANLRRQREIINNYLYTFDRMKKMLQYLNIMIAL